ncbi:hypothetical protein B0T22DRAFT_382916 [Podospora appendiculata]|uniref:Uncharacterized protein n=1 Tax=Podospora appendiculata TaxID=314037 RepID=A0AAE0X4Z2_9PEZI|nr:hypothetical protein B0T22DRAFT_382916 [Podospora appendiculata]
MSKPTPRKPRHRNQPSLGSGGPRQIPASDYESDAMHYMEARETPRLPHLPNRSNTDLNLSVLQRYVPSIQSISSIAANAVVYIFSQARQEWDKSGVEGTMFVCEQDPLVTVDGQELPQVCVFVLNRRGLDNLVVDLMRVSDCEMASELIMFRLEEEGGDGSSGSDSSSSGATPDAEQKVIGIWIHADEHDTREVNMDIIRSAWQRTRAALVQSYEVEDTSAAEQTDTDDGGADAERADSPMKDGAVVGRRLSVTDLFGQRNGGGMSVAVSRALTSTGPVVAWRQIIRVGQDFTAAEGSDCSEMVDNEPIDEPTVLAATVQAQLSLVDSFRRWMHEDLKDEWKKYADIFSTVSSRLDSYRQWLVDVEQYPTDAAPQPVVPWALRARVQPGSGGLTILVTGTRPNNQFEIFAKDKKEAEYLLSDQYFGCFSKMCQGFSQAEMDIAAMLQMARETKQERSALSQAPEVTTQTHIRLLKEYNDIKDIGQQLIGLVAENKGVRIGALYESGQYGVEAED